AYYLRTTPYEDSQVRAMLNSQVGDTAPYRPWQTCRNFSQDQFNKIKNLGIGTPAMPPLRSLPPQSSMTTVPIGLSTVASDPENTNRVSSSTLTHRAQ